MPYLHVVCRLAVPISSNGSLQVTPISPPTRTDWLEQMQFKGEQEVRFMVGGIVTGFRMTDIDSTPA
jgi:hypothetical protein